MARKTKLAELVSLDSEGIKAGTLLEGSYPIDTGIAKLITDDYTPNGWVLEINGMESSHIVLDKPLQLDFEYMRWFATLLDYYTESYLDAEKLRITHLGGGACSMARYCCARYPKSRNTVVELDGKLAQYVRQWFALPRSPQLKIRVGEAREVTTGFLPQSRDVIIRDVFAGFVTPRPLTTLEFTEIVASKLADNGLYLVNSGDTRELKGVRADAAAIAQVFPYTCIIADPAMLKGRRKGNVVIAGAFAPLPSEKDPAMRTLMKQLLGGAVPAHYKDDAWVRNFAQAGIIRKD